MKITASIFEAFLKCPTKCFLRSSGDVGTGNLYADWVRNQSECYREAGTKRLVAKIPPGECALPSPCPSNLKTAKWGLAVEVPAAAQTLEVRLHAVERVASGGQGRPAQFIPLRFVFTNKLTRDDRLLLAFDAFVLSEMLAREVSLGKIIHGDDHATLKVKTSALTGEVCKLIGKVAALLSISSPPDLVLIRHCAECEFQARCKQKAIEKDDLSLLSRMSAKERSKLHSKGIFTVTQLSYTFRPRRRHQTLARKREKYHHALKALAIREKKVHIVGRPEVKTEGTPVFLDVEALPDREFYYLIGVRVKTPDGVVQHSLWAGTEDEEKGIWERFLGILATTENPVLIHYGSYETRFLKRMLDRYGEPLEGSSQAKAIKSAVNLLALMFAQIYFPTFSNGLKEVAGQMGFRWSGSPASGLEAIVLRHEWAISGGALAQQALVVYNMRDCEALDFLATKLLHFSQACSQSGVLAPGEVVQTENLKWENPYGFGRNIFVLPELEAINKAAYWDYQRERVYVKSNSRLKHSATRDRKSRKVLPPDKTVECNRPRSCPACKSKLLYQHGRATKTVFDMKFMRHGIKRWIICYRFHRYRCRECDATFYPRTRLWTRSKYGSDLVAYAMYQNIELRLPQRTIAASLNKLFGFQLALGMINDFKSNAAKAYEPTYKALVQRLCNGQLLHADETKVSVEGKDGFVWVLASMGDVAYFYTDTREGKMLESLLKTFKGVLVSDFYAVYDGIQCQQQKCLIHLIRDLNDALLKSPYDDQLKLVARNFADLVRPIVETVDRYGLKKHFLRKHLRSVDQFYKNLPDGELSSEPAAKLIDRLQKNRNKLFTFLRFDGVPWNNNNAEHAVKPLAMLRRVIGGVTSENGIHEYLVLLSICETCKYREVDFLDFLRSGEKDIAVFAKGRAKRKQSRSPQRRVP